jgi:hypothetical protein
MDIIWYYMLSILTHGYNTLQYVYIRVYIYTSWNIDILYSTDFPIIIDNLCYSTEYSSNII